MGYITELRKLVGHRPLIMAASGVLLEDAQGRLLLQQRTDNGQWGYPGGSVELDEAVEDAARRELLEETGLIAGKMEWFGIFSGPQMHFVYPNGDETSVIECMWICRDWSGMLKRQAEEVQTLKFFAPGEIPVDLTSTNQVVINAYLNKRKEELS